jgi:hypothetical protein
MRLGLNAERRQPLLCSIDAVLSMNSLPVLLVERDHDSRGRRPAQAGRALCVAAHDVDLHAQQPRQLTGAVQCTR